MRKNKKELSPEEKAEQKEIFDAIDKGIPEISDERKKELETYAKNTIAKTKPVSIRLPVKDLAAIQKKAEEIGMPYQTLINLLIHQYSQGKIQLVI